MTPCADSVCKEGTAQNGCFCLEAKDDATPPTRESETETLVMILVIIRFKYANNINAFKLYLIYRARQQIQVIRRGDSMILTFDMSPLASGYRYTGIV